NYAPHYSIAHGAKDDPTSRDCSSCHHDHQGRDFALSKISDAACLRCHQDLNQIHPRTATAPISNFNRDHPEFRAVKPSEYERTMKFSHALHLSLGVSHSAGDAGLHGLTPG